jgi:hypothetical protein
MSEDLKLFIGAGALVVICLVASVWAPDLRAVAATQFGALVGAAAMKMKGNQ